MVGINTAVAGVGLGLAIPINATTRRIVSALMRDGRVRRAWIGIAGGARPVPPRTAAALGRDRAVEVVEVVGGSPAADAGLRAEDLIVAVDGVPVRGVDDLQRLMDAERIGVAVRLDLFRDGEPRGVRAPGRADALVPRVGAATSTVATRPAASGTFAVRRVTTSSSLLTRPAPAPRRPETPSP